MRITISGLLFFLFCGEVLFAQSSTSNNPEALKAGIYLSPKDFIDNTPWEVPFTVSKKYHTKKVIDSNEVQRIDTADISYVCQLTDSTKKPNGFIAYGFCDGEVRYCSDPNKVSLFRKTRFYKLEEKGKYPFFLARSDPSLAFILISPAFLVASTLANSVKITGMDVWYFNKKGELRMATPQSIGWLLRDDPDLRKQYNNEHKLSNAIYIKYLVLMNNRYHYKGYQEMKMKE